MNTKEKPTTAYILSLIAGIFILLGGLMSFVFAAIFTSFSRWTGVDEWSTMMEWFPRMMMGWLPGLGLIISIVGIVFGVIIIYSAIMLNSRPEQHTTWGTLVLLFSILSIIGAMAGFGIGMILGIIGGALAISWRPTMKAIPSGRFCPNCGRASLSDAKFCPHCGKELPP